MACPRVINVDKNPAYPAAVDALKEEGVLPRRVRLRQCKYLNNVVEQDHRTVKKRTWLAKGYGSFLTAWRTLQGIEAVHMIRKGRARCGEGGCNRAGQFHLPNCLASPRNSEIHRTASIAVGARSTEFRNEAPRDIQFALKFAY